MSWTISNRFKSINYYGPTIFVFYCCCIAVCTLAWWSFASECFVFENFFIVWTFKLWRKGGRIGLGMLCGEFYIPLVLCLIDVDNPSYLECFFWVFWYLFWDMSIPILIAACYESRCLNFFEIQLSHFFR